MPAKPKGKELRGTGWLYRAIDHPEGLPALEAFHPGDERRRIVIEGERGMDEEVLREYLTTRCLEDDVRVAMGERRTADALVAAGFKDDGRVEANAPELRGEAERARTRLEMQVRYSRGAQQMRALQRDMDAARAAMEETG